MKMDEFPSGVNKSEPIGEKQIPRIIAKVSGYRMLDADPTYGKRFRSYEPKKNGLFIQNVPALPGVCGSRR